MLSKAGSPSFVGRKVKSDDLSDVYSSSRNLKKETEITSRSFFSSGQKDRTSFGIHYVSERKTSWTVPRHFG